MAVLERPDVQTFTVSVPTGEEIEETFLAIQELPGRKLVTVIEVLSPTNKKTKDARAEYLKKRDDLDPHERQLRGDRFASSGRADAGAKLRRRRPITEF